jgi:hypothetical protein
MTPTAEYTKRSPCQVEGFERDVSERFLNRRDPRFLDLTEETKRDVCGLTPDPGDARRHGRRGQGRFKRRPRGRQLRPGVGIDFDGYEQAHDTFHV